MSVSEPMITSSDGAVGLENKGLWLMVAKNEVDVAHSEENECNS